ncbi:hypothetical protein ScPMuIL_002119 [Solemya velum]
MAFCVRDGPRPSDSEKFEISSVTTVVLMIPRLGNIKQIDFAQMELENVSDDIDPFFTKAEMSKMSNYEKLRFKNMRKNFEMMVAVGLPVPKPSFMKNVRSRRKKVVEPESDDSDEDWTPATERRKSNRGNQQPQALA